MTRVHHEFSPVDVVGKYWKSGLNLMLGQAPLNTRTPIFEKSEKHGYQKHYLQSRDSQ
jgi:hypothetical protein